MEAALAAQRAGRTPTGCNPDNEFRAGWLAAMREVTVEVEWGVTCHTCGDGHIFQMPEENARYQAEKEGTIANLVTRSRIYAETEWENAS